MGSGFGDGAARDALAVGDATLLAAAEADFEAGAGARTGSLAASIAVGQEILLAALRALGDRLAEVLAHPSDANSASRASGPGAASRTSRSDVHSPQASGWTPNRNSNQNPNQNPNPNQTSNQTSRWDEIHLLLVGGAAGMLSGLLDPERTTTDCDVMLYHPVEAGEFVEQIAGELAGEFGLSERWLNRGGAPWAEAMPAGWEARRMLVLSHGPLRVHAVGRLDLIALKLVAGRAQDIEDLETMSITAEEFDTLRGHFEGWTDDSWPSGVIAGAIELLDILADVPEANGRGEDPHPSPGGSPQVARLQEASPPKHPAVGTPAVADGRTGPDAAARRAERVRRFLDGEVGAALQAPGRGRGDEAADTLELAPERGRPPRDRAPNAAVADAQGHDLIDGGSNRS